MMIAKPVLRHLKTFYWRRREDPFGTAAAVSIRRNKNLARTSDSLRHVFTGKAHTGYCPVCDDKTIFLIKEPWLRDNYRCVRCDSIPRFRHVIEVLRKEFPHFRELFILKSSPDGPVFKMLQRESTAMSRHNYWPNTEPGTNNNGFRCENLEAFTFPDGSFETMITQDVLEHVFSPALAFAEILRTL